MTKLTINFKEWAKEKPNKSAIESALQSEETIEEFHSILCEYVTSPDEFVYNEWVAIHALRLLIDKRDLRALPLVAKIIEDEGEEWESMIVDSAHTAIDSLATAEAQSVFLELYEKSKKVTDEDYRRTLLRALFQTGYRSEETDSKMLREFYREPAQISFDFASSKETKWIPLLEKKLRELAPFVKYVPNREKFDSITLNWREVASAWFELKCIDQGNFEYVRSAHDFKFYEEFKPVSESEKNKLLSLFDKESKERDKLAKTTFLDLLPETFTDFRNLPGTNQILVQEIASDIQDALMAQSAYPEKTGRNDPCPCGSGKKYKKCCI